MFREGAECATCNAVEARCIAHRVLALVHQYFGDSSRALEDATAAVCLAREEGLSEELLRALNTQVLVLLYRGALEKEEGRAATAAAEALAMRSGDLILRYHLCVNRGVWLLDVGELERAERVFEEGAKLLGDTDAMVMPGNLCINFGELYYELGMIDEARTQYSRALELPGVARHWFASGMAHAGIGLCALHAGDLKEVRRREELLRRVVRDRPLWVNDPSTMVRFLAQASHRRGDTAGAVAMLEQTAEAVRQRQVPNWIKLKLEAARLASRISKRQAAATAREAYEVAFSLGLARRCQQLEVFL